MAFPPVQKAPDGAFCITYFLIPLHNNAYMQRQNDYKALPGNLDHKGLGDRNSNAIADIDLREIYAIADRKLADIVFRKLQFDKTRGLVQLQEL